MARCSLSVILTGLFVLHCASPSATPAAALLHADLHPVERLRAASPPGRKDKYRLVMIVLAVVQPRLATDADVTDREHTGTGSKTAPACAFQVRLAGGLIDLIYQDPERSYIDAPLSAYLKECDFTVAQPIRDLPAATVFVSYRCSSSFRFSIR